ncbi:MAG: hypothetical protein WC310_03270 [Patescibacteria group bacterium]|jgi:hypothetical protein
MTARPNLVIIGDFGKDLDDEHTLLVAARLARQGIINLKAVVANLSPAHLRARIAKGMLKQLDLDSVPVAVGTPVFEGKTHPYETRISYLADLSEVLPNGFDLLKTTLLKSSDRNVILVLQSGMTDAAELLDREPFLFTQKIRQVAIMGGVETENKKIKLDIRGMMTPNNANNNEFDRESAVFLYWRLQELKIPMIITTRDAAYACQFPLTVYDDMENTGNPIGDCLKGRQKPALQKLWQAACSAPESKIRGTLPVDRNRQWFVKVFCGDVDPAINDGDDIWSYVQNFNLYDPINFVAAIPNLIDTFFDPTEVWVNGVRHLVIGVSSDNHGVRDIDGLRQFLTAAETSALRF